MSISLSKEAEDILDAAVKSGSYPTRDAAVQAAAMLLGEREKKLAWLRAKIQRSIERGGSYTDEEVGESIEATLDEWERNRKNTQRAAE